MPYYIDQDKGWNGLYNSFSNIDQYRQDDRIKSLYYHLSIYNKYTVELMAQKDQMKDEIEKLKKEEEHIRITLNALSQETQNLIPAKTEEELEKYLQIPKEQISSIVKKAGEVRNKIQSLETILNQHKYQLEIIKEYRNIKNNMKNVVQERLYSCPQCGYTFDEEIYNIVRSNYNIHNEDYMCQQIQLIINSILEELDRYKKQYIQLMNNLEEQEKVFDESEDQHHAASLLDKILGSFTLPFSLTGGYQSPLPSESLESLKVRQVEQLIISAYEHGNVVIVGRGGQVVLAGKPDVLHVRVVAPLEKRIQTWMAREDLSYEAARKRVHERDKAHIDFVETFFDCDLNDCSLYDLVVNTNRYPPERAVDLILLALKSLEETI